MTCGMSWSGLLGEAGPAEVRREKPGHSQNDAHSEQRRRGDRARPPADRRSQAPAETVRGSVLAERTGELAVRSGAAARGRTGLAGRLTKRGGVVAERTEVLVDLGGTRANRRGTPAYRDDRAWCLDAREPGPRCGPALGGLRPRLIRLRPRRSGHPDAVEVASSPDLVLRSAVRDGHPVKHDPALSWSCRRAPRRVLPGT